MRSRADDMSSDEKLLEKYGLKANDAILAEEKHMGLYDDLIQNHDAKLIAGGAAQNTARGAQVGSPSHKSTCTQLLRYILLVHPPTEIYHLHRLHRPR